MARICIVCPGQLGRSPRGLRNADALAAAGHDVVVVYPDYQPGYRQYDAALVARARWRTRPLDFCATRLARLRWQFVRARHRLAAKIARRGDSLFWLERAQGYFGPELAAAAVATGADLCFAQTQSALPQVARAAAANGQPYAVDIEDLLADCTDEAVDFVQTIERRFLGTAAVVCTMSSAAADRLVEVHGLASRPIVLPNCPALGERGALPPPEDRPPAGTVSLYWFGQTIGPHSCAEAMLRALPRLVRPARLVLRGTATCDGYVDGLRRLATELGLGDAVVVEPPAAPAEMVVLAGRYEFCFGTQPGRQLFHQLAIGNKVFTGMMAGAVVVLTDTIAHRQLLAAHPGWALPFGDNSPEQLAAGLNPLLAAPQRLAAMRRTAWDLAGTVFNWETQSQLLIAAVARVRPLSHRA